MSKSYLIVTITYLGLIDTIFSIKFHILITANLQALVAIAKAEFFHHLTIVLSRLANLEHLKTVAVKYNILRSALKNKTWSDNLNANAQ